MTIRILFCLITCIAAFTTCKKDRDKKKIYYFKGLVLQQATNLPLANARVTIDYINSRPDIPYKRFFDSTHTNNNGEYAFEVQAERLAFRYYYLLNANKDSLQQSSYNLNQLDVESDTIYFENPSYLQITVKITHAAPDGVTLDYGFINHKDSSIPPFFPLDTVPVFYNPGTYNLPLTPFSRTLYPTAHAALYTYIPPVPNTKVAEKTITPEPYKTTHAIIEY